MKLRLLIAKLYNLTLAEPTLLDAEVLVYDRDTGDTFDINTATVHVAEEDEYPEEYDMPEGYKFIELR